MLLLILPLGEAGSSSTICRWTTSPVTGRTSWLNTPSSCPIMSHEGKSMVRSFPDFWKLNCSHCRRAGTLTADLWRSVVTCVPWAWQLDFEHLWPSQTSSFPYHVVSEGSNKNDLKCAWWTALRNHERRIWNCIPTFIFLMTQSQRVPQVISMYPHCETDWLRVKTPFVLLFGADQPSFGIIHICNFEVILGLMSVALF